MKYADRKRMMDELSAEHLKATGKGWTPADAEGHFRYYVLQLLADIADSQGSMAYCYQEMLKLQQSRGNGPGPGPRQTKPQAEPHPLAPLPSTPPAESRYGPPRPPKVLSKEEAAAIRAAAEGGAK